MNNWSGMAATCQRKLSSHCEAFILNSEHEKTQFQLMCFLFVKGCIRVFLFPFCRFWWIAAAQRNCVSQLKVAPLQ